MARQAFGGQARGLRDGQVSGVVAQTVELERGVGVFGHGLDGYAADFQQRFTTDDRTGAAEEGGVPQVVAVLHQAVEQLALVGHGAEGVEVLFERVWREEEVRRLQHRQLRVFEEPAQAHLQEGARRHVVGVEQGDVFTVGDLQRFVKVTGLGVEVVVAANVVHADLAAEVAEVVAAAVVQHVDTQLVLGPVHCLGGEDGQFYDAQRFVISGDEHVDRRPLFGLGLQPHWRATQRPGGLHVAEDQHDQGVELGRDQAVAEEHVDPGLEPEGGGEPPEHVAQRRHQ